MKRVNVLLVLFLVLGFVSCNRQEVARLNVINKMLDLNNLDSAKMMLRTVKVEQLSSDEAKAIYPLLVLKKSWLEGKDVADTLLMEGSIAYFWQNSRLDLLSDVYYFRGCLEFKDGLYEKALFHMKEAERYAIKCGDVKREHAVYQKLYAFNYIIDEMDYANFYAKKVNDISRKMEVGQFKGKAKTMGSKQQMSKHLQYLLHDMQKEYDLKIASNASQKMIFNSFSCIVLLLLFVLWYWRADYRKNKFAVQIQEQKYDGLKATYEVQIKRMKDDNNKREALLYKQKELALKLQVENLAKGQKRYQEIKEGGKTLLWSKRDFENFISYYELISPSFFTNLNIEFYELSPQSIFYKILCAEGKTDDEIRTVLGKSNGALRTMKSRINAKKK